jgi:hypothetical protein
MLIIVSSVLIEGPHVTPDLKGDPSKRFSLVGPGVPQAIGVISFAFGELVQFISLVPLLTNILSLPP